MPLLRRAGVVAASALILAPAAAAATTPSTVNPPHLTKAGAHRAPLPATPQSAGAHSVRPLTVGEAAGFQDYLFGLGIR